MRAVNPDEPVEIVDYDPHYEGRYRAERDRVRLGLATASLKFEHIGSTAVPGLAGKPIVDLMLGASPTVWAALEELRPRVVALGYEDLGEAGVPGRIYFRKRTALRAFNLALVEEGGALWRDNLALRDYLRATPGRGGGVRGGEARGDRGRRDDVAGVLGGQGDGVGALVEKARVWRGR